MMLSRSMILAVLLLAAGATAQQQPQLTPPPVQEAPEGPEVAPAPETPPGVTATDDGKPPFKANPGWARTGAGLGFALSVVPLGGAIAGQAVWWAQGRAGQGNADVITMVAALTAPLVGLIPTFAGRSAVVADENLRRPRFLRIIGWVLTGLGTVGLGTSPLYTRAFQVVGLGDGGPGFFGTAGAVFNGLLCTGGIVLLSFGALRSAQYAEEPPESNKVQSVQNGIEFAPTLAVIPGRDGNTVVSGIAGRF